MRLYRFFLLFVFLLPGFVFAQSPEEELTLLKQYLDLPPESNFSLSPQSKIPNSNPLKIFIGTGLDMIPKQNYLRWIDKWNKKDGKKKGIIQVVDSVQEAELILARISLKEKVGTEEQSYVVPGTVYNFSTRSFVTTPVSGSRSISVVPVFSYIILKDGGSFKIIYRDSGTGSLSEHKKSGQWLWDDFKKLLKKRYKEVFKS